MDCSLPVVPSHGGLPWSNRRSMDSDDERSMILDHAPRWMDASFSACEAPSTAATLPSSGGASHLARAGQLSPISTSMDMAMTADSSCGNSCPPSATAPAMVHSASSSSCADSWSVRFGDSEELSGGEGGNDVDVHWEQGSDDILTVPKPEPMDDDYFCLEEFKEAPLTPVPCSNSETPGVPKAKRPRGRPRKHPLPPNCSANKVTKGRSKTGCITCRKRKKKCDEAKPRCMNCEKNAVVCEGYPEKQIWKSGKERAEEARLQTESIPMITMQPIFDGLETLEDRIFWKHYNDHLSTVLTVESEHRNAFKEMLIPIATRDRGLMHSILSLSSIHLDYDTPYAANLLRKHPKTSVAALRERSGYHQIEAMDALRSRDASSDLSLSAMYGQMLCLILESVADGRSGNQHRLHLTMYRNLIQESPPQDPAFRAFITEFFQYHIFADQLVRHPGNCGDPSLLNELASWKPREPIEPPRLLGVADGLFRHLCEITAIRNRIRSNIAAQVDPLVDYPSLYKAEDINQAISEWDPCWPTGDSRERVAPLYKQMMWVYLYRTVYPPSLGSPVCSASASATTATSSVASLAASSLKTPASDVPPVTASSSLVTTPPKSPSSSCSSSPGLRPGQSATWPHEQHLPPPYCERRHSIAHLDSGAARFSSGFVPSSDSPGTSNLTAPSKRSGSLSSSTAAVAVQQQIPHQYHRQALEQQQEQLQQHPRADSPPPIRRSCNPDPRVTLAVEQSLMIIDSLKPTDPAQTLLLIPCLVVGTACFTPAQQDRIRAAVRTVRGYTGLRNADRVAELLEEVWRLMAAGDWLAVWDWQGVASRMGLDFLCA